MPSAMRSSSAAPAPAKPTFVSPWHPRSFAIALGGGSSTWSILVNQLEQEKAAGRSGRLAETLLRYDVIVIDELGYLPFSQPGG
jgi:hypothetical protein